MRYIILSVGILAARMLSAQPAPLTLTLHPVKPVWLAGESITLGVHVKAGQAMQMDSIELNRTGTRIHLRRGTAQPVVLTGADHIRLFPRSAMAGIGSSFAVKANQEWDATIDLFQYTRPLPVGSYSVSLEFRGARTATVRFAVSPAEVTGARWRWFGADQPRAELAGIYTVASPSGSRWIHSARPGHDLSIVIYSVEIASGRREPTDPPRLAYFPGISGLRPERLAVWTEHANLCWLAVTGSGPSGSVQCIPSGLTPPLRIAEPALQTAQGELRAVVFNAAGDLREVRANPGETPKMRNIDRIPQLKDAAVSWEPAPSLLTAVSSPSGVQMNLVPFTGPPRRLPSLSGEWSGWLTEEWNGFSRIYALTRHVSSTSAHRWSNQRPGELQPVKPDEISLPPLYSAPSGVWRLNPSAATALQAQRVP